MLRRRRGRRTSPDPPELLDVPQAGNGKLAKASEPEAETPARPFRVVHRVERWYDPRAGHSLAEKKF